MTKKFIIPVVLVLVLALGIGSVAYAADVNLSDIATSPSGQAVEAKIKPAAAGQVTAVGDNQFTVKTRKGVDVTVHVNASTVYRSPSGSSLGFSDLKVGLWVSGRFAPEKSKGNPPDKLNLVARQVIIFPQGFDPSLIDVRTTGTVANVDPAANSFTLSRQKGSQVTFKVVDTTLFAGKQVQSLADLKVGMQAAVGAKKLSDGSLQAEIIHARLPLVRNAGKITAIDPANQTFTLHTLKGKDVIFKVDANTRFISRKGDVKSLVDLKIGMRAIVAAHYEADGSLLARRVAAGRLAKAAATP